MRICILNHNLRDQGSWHRAWPVARQLRLLGHDVMFVTVHPQRRVTALRREVEGIQVVETPFLGPRRLAASGVDLWDLLFRLSFLSVRRFDVVYAFDALPNVGIPWLWCKRLYRAVFIMDWADLYSDGGIYQRFNRWPLRTLYRMERWLELHTKQVADVVTVISHYLERKALQLRPAGRVIYLPPGAPCDVVVVRDPQEARRRWSLPADAVIVGYISGGFTEDGIVLLEAFAKALSRDSRLFLLFKGTRDARYQACAERLGIVPRIRFVDWVAYEQLGWLLAAADMLAVPLHDGENSRARFPNKLVEYLCAGRAVVGTGLGEVQHVLGTYKVGVLTDVTPASFAAGIVQLADDVALRMSFGCEARRVAEQEISWPAMLGRLTSKLHEWQLVPQG